MLCPRSSSTRVTLFRIFVQPSQTSWTVTPSRSLFQTVFQTSHEHYRSIQLRHSRLPQYRGYATRQQRSNKPEKAPQVPTNEAIGTLYVNFVDSNGAIQVRQPLRQLLSTFTRATHTLLVVQPGNPNAPRDAMEHWPVTKIFSHEELRKREKEKEQHRVEQKRLMASSKIIELSWTISEHDLGHRLKKAKEFLEEGRKVEIMLARKKRSRPVTAAECRRLVDRIEGELEQVKDAKETKPSTGKPEGPMTLFWEGKRKKKDRVEGVVQS